MIVTVYIIHPRYFNILHINEAWITFIHYVLWVLSNIELHGLSSTTFVSTLWPWVPSITHFWEKCCKVLRFAKYFWTLVIFFNWVSNTYSFFVNKWREKFFYLCKQHFSKLYFLEIFYAKKWLVDFQGLTSTNFNVFIVIANG